MQQIKTTELDFDQIRANIKDHFKRQDSVFKDWNFEGSGLSLITNLLAYNTHYNAILAHLSLNESFIDSAQVRKNVVSKAKLLGYTPHSKKAPVAKINLTLSFKAAIEAQGFILPRGTEFLSVVDGKTYTFVTIDDIKPTTVSANTWISTGIEIYQGSFRTERHLVSAESNQRFRLNHSSVDTSTLKINVYENEISTKSDSYSLFSSLNNIDSVSKVYFIQENMDGYFEVYFGDGKIGKKLNPLNIVEISYLITEGADANDIGTFTLGGTLDDEIIYLDGTNNSPSIEIVNRASGGSDKESIESIRYNSPLTFIAQNRAVTVDDYRSLIKSLINVDAISVWGGENNNPPEYGKVFISIKPSGADALTTTAKNNLKNDIRGKNMLTIIPEFVDPEYLYIYFDLFFKYSSNLTNLTKGQLESLALTAINEYDTDNLTKFDGVFRYSNFLSKIDNIHPSVLSSYARVYVYKNQLIPAVNATAYTIDFDREISKINGSSAFLISGVKHYVKYNTNTEKLYLYYINTITNTEVIVNSNVGTVDKASGKILLNKLAIDTDTIVSFYVQLASNDIVSRRNQLLSIDSGLTTINGSIDTVAVSGSAGALNYETINRDS